MEGLPAPPRGVQAFNWRRPSASSHRARLRRMPLVDALHGPRALAASVGAAAHQSALRQVLLRAVEYAPQVGAAVVETARGQHLAFRDRGGLVRVVVLES